MNNIDKMRPTDMHNKALLLREESGVNFFLKNHESFVNINCPCCKTKHETREEFYKYGFKHLKCTNCNTLYVSPRPTEESLFNFYSNYAAPKYWTELLVATNNDRKYLQHEPRVNKLSQILISNHNRRELFIDLGAGNGNFSKAVDEKKIFENVIATDISDECIESCKNQGLETMKATINDFKDSTIDCITFNDLIEHVYDPYTFIEQCYRKLRSNGILMLSTPNGEGFDFKILKDKTENITPPEHLQYFNPESIKILLENIGFETIEISTPGILDVSIIKRQINEKMLDLKSDNSFIDFLYSLKNNSIEESFQNFLQENNLSSHMLVFAKKL